MKYKWLYGYIAILLIVFCAKKSLASLKINEFSSASEEEWIELYNDDSQNAIEITDWVIQDTTSSSKEAELFKFTEKTIVPPNGFCVKPFNNRLNNGGDRIRLVFNGEVKDCVAYGNGNSSFCRDNKDLDSPLGNLTGARKPDGSENWILGPPTKGYSNLMFTEPSEKLLCYSPTSTTPPTPSVTSEVESVTLTSIPTVFSTQFPISNIFISEVMVNPEKDNNEWVEFFNNNDFEVNLDNWYLDDIENAGSTPREFSLTIPAKGYAAYELTSSIFNNDGDQVRLLDFDQNLKDSLEYAASSQGKTFGRVNFDSDNFCLQAPTKNFANNSCLETSPSPAPTKNPTLTNQPTKELTESKTPKPTLEKQLPIDNYQLPITDSSAQILGETIHQSKGTPSKNTIKGLSFISFSYSLLTIVSIFLKINR